LDRVGAAGASSIEANSAGAICVFFAKLAIGTSAADRSTNQPTALQIGFKIV
jgi:hypothetical protein